MLPIVVISLAVWAAAAPPDGQTQKIHMSANGEFIADHYPPKALKAGQQGKVSFRLVVEPDGSLGTCEVTKSSGYKSLDDETCELILRYARLKVVRNSDGRSIRAEQNGFINWVHPQGRGKRANAIQIASANTPDKIICKRSPTTGSLVKKTKQCMTARQWAEASRIARDKAYAIVGQGYHEDGDACEGAAGC